MVALLVAGCSGGDDDEPATTTTSAVVTTVPVTTTGAVRRRPPDAPHLPRSRRSSSGPTASGVVDFGATKDATLAALSAAFGPVDETGTGCELAGPDVTTARWDELRVQFVGGGVRLLQRPAAHRRGCRPRT